MSTQLQDNAKKHYDILDIYKFIAAVLIIFHHYQQTFDVHYPGINFFGGKFHFGNMVELFFIISGFVAANSLHNSGGVRTLESCGKAWIHKAKRIYPMAWIACSCCIATALAYRLIIGEWSDGAYTNWKCIIESYLLIFRGWPKLEMLGINNPTWYLSVLLLCYAVYYIMSAVSQKLRIKIIFFLILAEIITQIGHRLPYLELIFTDSAKRGYEMFFLGVILFEVLPKMNGRQLKIVISVLLAALIAVCLVSIELVFERQRLLCDVLLYPSLIILAYIFRDFSCSISHKLGAISFEMFLFHVPTFCFMDFVATVLKYKPHHSYASMLVATISVILLSLLIEKIRLKVKSKPEIMYK